MTTGRNFNYLMNILSFLFYFSFFFCSAVLTANLFGQCGPFLTNNNANSHWMLNNPDLSVLWGGERSA